MPLLQYPQKKVLLVGKARGEPAVSSERWDMWGFKQLDMEVQLVNTIGRGDPTIMADIMSRGHHDLVIYYFSHGMTKNIISNTKRIAGMNAVSTFDYCAWGGQVKLRHFMEMAAITDFAIHTGGVPELKDAIVAHQGCEPLLILKKPEANRTGKPVFVGHVAKNRRSFVELLKENDADVTGTSRKNEVRRAVLFKLCHNRSVVLAHIRTLDHAKVWDVENYWSNRLYVMTGFGACLLHPNCPGIEKEYQDGANIVLYNTYEEMIEKMHALRKDPERCNFIGENAYTHTRENHTYAHRALKILEGVFGENHV